MVDGIAQKPIEGVSMAYTFDKANANAPSTHKTQYFEITDQTTYQRLKAFVEELRDRLQRRLAARRPKQEITARAHELWEQHGRPTGRDLEFWLQAERELSEDENA
jgi:hypothetical protein